MIWVRVSICEYYFIIWFISILRFTDVFIFTHYCDNLLKHSLSYCWCKDLFRCVLGLHDLVKMSYCNYCWQYCDLRWQHNNNNTVHWKVMRPYIWPHILLSKHSLDLRSAVNQFWYSGQQQYCNFLIDRMTHIGRKSNFTIKNNCKSYCKYIFLIINPVN